MRKKSVMRFTNRIAGFFSRLIQAISHVSLLGVTPLSEGERRDR